MIARAIHNAVLIVGAVVALLFSSPFVQAGEQTGTVTYVVVRDSDGLIYFWLTGTHANRPACAASHDYWMIANENSETGKRHFAMLMLAKAQGTTIQVSGKNTCARWSDGEDVGAITYLP